MAFDGSSAEPTAVVVLASASPRRRALLELAGIPHRVEPSRVDEDRLAAADPAAFTRRAARHKARAVAERSPAGSWVLGADTSVVLDERLLGKPRDVAHGRRMLQQLSGRDHEVLTAVCLQRAGDGRPAELLARTRVSFRTLAPDWIEGYLASGEPMDKAGAYGIQGLGALLVRAIDGSYTNVVGLPLGETVDLLVEREIWRPFGGGGQA